MPKTLGDALAHPAAPPRSPQPVPPGHRNEELPVRHRRRSIAPYLLLIPVLVALILALAYPLGRQVIMSFQGFGLAQQLGTKPPEWVGVDNYVTLLTDKAIWAVIARSLAFCFVNASLTMIIGTALATLMTKTSTTFRLILSTALLFAWAMPVIAAMTVWEWLFNSDYGVINWILTRLGGDFTGHSWLTNPLSFFFVATVVVVWMSVPFVVFSVYSALTQVSEEVLEAAALDGAGGWQRFRHIILPTIMPVLSVVTMLQIIWDLRVFTQIFYLQGAGGLASKTDLLGTFIYRLGISQSDYGLASAVALFVLILTLIVTSGYVRSLFKEADA
ncbi:carbohydrate ABC transporter permease [Jonesia denitrificans]|uniref:Binding-protein-dependent transport systems inner membrane component n=1 Tax=Jonesia denitrificans (strain ATCC 14870 / DSM 20603 / BCRC 15368 / CIP 55.134 / JCM 11481 / NBRC 15587 / NCTC 10816 / Prevot 55134) TaxID=471856 RepID=C7QZ01_JONDD|nr:sugar ABC transporter permease [Jonesia denitrificans]ACV07909.1 binding-protein-dependent transport systems inner membrane component [Jonesia denitrificans DSM 20603]ASE08390.1 sugar ABC transporter permease [Jonesia denitrificans]QXB42993.1 sugar ABC transporter permease [Jonesia denitrificans]SQH19882.1 Inner membrane ABC transporter permease protein ycjO [Jonesia denitrificans]